MSASLEQVHLVLIPVRIRVDNHHVKQLGETSCRRRQLAAQGHSNLDLFRRRHNRETAFADRKRLRSPGTRVGRKQIIKAHGLSTARDNRRISTNEIAIDKNRLEAPARHNRSGNRSKGALPHAAARTHHRQNHRRGLHINSEVRLLYIVNKHALTRLGRHDLQSINGLCKKHRTRMILGYGKTRHIQRRDRTGRAGGAQNHRRAGNAVLCGQTELANPALIREPSGKALEREGPRQPRGPRPA